MKALILLLVQDPGDLLSPRPIRARVVLEESSKGEDLTRFSSGSLAARPGHAVLAEFRAPESRVVRRADSVGFHPLDVWRWSWPELLERFEFETEPESLLPEAVTDREGRPVAPVRVRLGAAARTAAGAVDRGDAAVCLRLLPRDPGLRERVGAVTVWAGRGSRLVERVRVEESGRAAVYTLNEIREVESIEDSVFERESKTEERR